MVASTAGASIRPTKGMADSASAPPSCYASSLGRLAMGARSCAHQGIFDRPGGLIERQGGQKALVQAEGASP